MVVYVRLYAMYAVVYYHQGNWERAKSYLETARHYLRDMTITESELLPLVEVCNLFFYFYTKHEVINSIDGI